MRRIERYRVRLQLEMPMGEEFRIRANESFRRFLDEDLFPKGITMRKAFAILKVLRIEIARRMKELGIIA